MSENYGRDAETKMKKSIEALQKDLAKVRTGRATPALLDGIRVESYGTLSPLNQIAAIATPDPKLITVSPWDKSLLSAVEKAIQASGLGLTPVRDKNIIRLPIPPLTEERRKILSKQCAKTCEESKISIRNIRREINETIKKAEKDKGLPQDDSRKEQDNIQKIVDDFIKQIDDIFKNKEKEIMSV